MKVRHISPLVSLTVALAIVLPACAMLASSDLRNNDPAQWTGEEVYQILNNSPWTKTVKVDFPNTMTDSLGRQSAPGSVNTNNSQSSATMGRRGMNGSRSPVTYSSGSAPAGSSSTKAGPTEVIVQWQSALVVRMATAKKEGGTADASSKSLDEYVIALIGLPVTAVGGRAAWADSDKPSAEDDRRVENNVKSSASIIRSGHDPLTPTKVELNQGRDDRVLIHFSKSDPILVKDKTVEFRLVMGKVELRRKFLLKDMEYQGKLEL